MVKRIIFFHGGGAIEDYEADKKLAESLKLRLGAAYQVDYPFLPNDGSPDLGRRKQIRTFLGNIPRNPYWRPSAW